MRARFSTFYGFCQIAVRLVSRVFFWRRILGRGHWVPGPAIIAANHASFLDPPLIGACCPEQIAYVARKDLFGNPVFRWLCRALGTIPIERDAADLASIKRILAALEAGRKVLLFPEGVRSSDGRTGRAMPGLGLLVQRARVPVIPVYIHGSYRAWPRHRPVPLPARIVVAFGPPVRFDQPPADAPPRREAFQAIADEVMARIIALKPRALAKA